MFLCCQLKRRLHLIIIFQALILFPQRCLAYHLFEIIQVIAADIYNLIIPFIPAVIDIILHPVIQRVRTMQCVEENNIGVSRYIDIIVDVIGIKILKIRIKLLKPVLPHLMSAHNTLRFFSLP